MRLHVRLLVPPHKRAWVKSLAEFFRSRSKKDLLKLGVNGCGAKGGRINPPEFSFGPACCFHDLLYIAGGNKWDRLTADALFLDLMLDSAKHARHTGRSPKLLAPFDWLAAHVYFVAVRLFGARHFRFGPRLDINGLHRRIWLSTKR